MTLENCLPLNDLFNYFGKTNNKNESITGFGTRKWNNLKHVAEICNIGNIMCPMHKKIFSFIDICTKLFDFERLGCGSSLNNVHVLLNI